MDVGNTLAYLRVQSKMDSKKKPVPNKKCNFEAAPKDPACDPGPRNFFSTIFDTIVQKPRFSMIPKEYKSKQCRKKLIKTLTTKAEAIPNPESNLAKFVLLKNTQERLIQEHEENERSVMMNNNNIRKLNMRFKKKKKKINEKCIMKPLLLHPQGDLNRLLQDLNRI